MEINEYLLAHKDDDNSTPPSSGNSDGNDAPKEGTNKGTLALDATCAPANIRYPQDISPLNEARDIGYLEKFMSDGYAMIDKEISFCLITITLYEQQKYMYGNKVRSVGHCIVSIHITRASA